MVKKAGWFVFFALLGAACLDEPECIGLNNDIVGISFKKMSDNKADTVFFLNWVADGKARYEINSTLSTLNLPLNFYEDETTFRFAGANQTFDLRLGYDSRSQFVSEECGVRFVLNDLKVLSHSFDSVVIVNATPGTSTATGKHLEIFRCPNTSRIEVKFLVPKAIDSIKTNYPATILLGEGEISTLNVPLNTEDSLSTIEFYFSGAEAKTITLKYSREKQILFPACGPQTVLSDLEVASTTFSSANVARSTIQDPTLTNLEITY